jgi:hypothetical protein
MITGMERELNDVGIAAAMSAFRNRTEDPDEPVRRVAYQDSGGSGRLRFPDAYSQEREAIGDAIRAYVDCVGVKNPLTSPLDKDALRRRLTDLDNGELGVVLALTLARIDTLGESSLEEMLEYLAAAVKELKREARR